MGNPRPKRVHCATMRMKRWYICSAAGTPTRRQKKVVLNNLEDKLVEVQTHPDLVTLILLAVDGKTEVLKETPIQQHNGEDMAKLKRQQENIGWHMVKYGIITLEWDTVQTK